MAIQSPASRPSAAHEILTSHDAAVGWPGRGFVLSPAALDPPPPTERVFATSQQLLV